MEINLAHRPDLENRVKKLADRLGLQGRGRMTATIERALEALEERIERDAPDQSTIRASIDRYIEAGPDLRSRLAKELPTDAGPLSSYLQEALYNERGVPE